MGFCSKKDRVKTGQILIDEPGELYPQNCGGQQILLSRLPGRGQGGGVLRDRMISFTHITVRQ